MIRQWCDAMGDRNPAYSDAAAARETVHGGVVAPPTMLQAWTMQGFAMARGYDEPRDNEHRIHKLLEEHGYTSVVATNTEQTYTRYLRPGDVVTAETSIESISEEKATALGIGYFIDTRTSFRDEDGAEVGQMSFRVLKLHPAAAARGRGGGPGRGGEAEANPPAARPRQRLVVAARGAGGAPDPEVQRLWEAPSPAAADVRPLPRHRDGPRGGVGPRHRAHLHGDPPPAVPRLRHPDRGGADRSRGGGRASSRIWWTARRATSTSVWPCRASSSRARTG